MGIKITELVEDTAPTSDDLIMTVNDPSGSPINKKVTIGNLFLNAPQLQVSGHSAFGNDAGIDKDYLGGIPQKNLLDIREVVVDLSLADFNSSFSWTTINPLANWPSHWVYGLNNFVITDAGNGKDGAGFVAGFNETIHLGSGTIGLMEAGVFYAGVQGVGTVLDAKTLEIGLYASGGGSIIDGYAFYIQDTYGQATNAWNIYSAGVNSRNVFEGRVLVGDGSVATPSLANLTYPNTGIFFDSGVIKISHNGNLLAWFNSAGFNLNQQPLNFGGGYGEPILLRDDANTLALRNGVNPQTFNWYATYTDTSNYEGGYLTAGAGLVTLGARTLGTGMDDIDVKLLPTGTGKVRFGTYGATGDVACNGYITIKDEGGATRKIMTCA